MNLQDEFNKRLKLQKEYLGNDKEVNKIQPLVSVNVQTYQHAKYIGECLDSILMQKTDFPFEILIGEDGSTDGTRKICIKYAEKNPDKIRLFLRDRRISHIKNVHGYFGFNAKFNRKMSKGKYIALCEGDDYWIDSSKLQKQISYMEKNPQCSLSFHAAEIINNFSRTRQIIRASKENHIFPKNKLFGYGSGAATSSLVFKKKPIEEIPLWLLEAPVGDIPLKMFLSQFGTVDYINEVMVARRVGSSESWSTRMNKSSARISLYPGMIKMLDGFNKFSNYKYSDEVYEKQLMYEIKGLDSWIPHPFSINKILQRDKYYSLIKNKTLNERIRVYFTCYLLGIKTKIESSWIGWNLKKIFSNKS